MVGGLERSMLKVMSNVEGRWWGMKHTEGRVPESRCSQSEER